MIATVYRIVLRTEARPTRLAALTMLGLVGVLSGVAIGFGDVTDRLDAGTRLVNSFGLSLYAPVVSLVFASAALGDQIEDGTLVYLWLRPVARWRVVAGAAGAALTVSLPLVVGVLVVAATLSRGGAELLAGTVVSATIAVLAYTGVFTLLGLYVRRALAWGLVYLLLWEGFVALAGTNAARLAVRSYTRSLLAEATGIDLRLATASPVTAVVVPLVVATAALALAARRLEHMEVP